jgi:hypothetical protein
MGPRLLFRLNYLKTSRDFAPKDVQSKAKNPPDPLSGILRWFSPATQEKYGSAQTLFNRARENGFNNYFNKRLYATTFINLFRYTKGHLALSFISCPFQVLL